MKAKFLSALLILILIPAISFSAEQKEMAADYVARIQNEISSDISKLRASAETELEGMKLESTDIARRIQEISELTAKSSDDMAAWGYTPEQRELHSRILSELAIAYSAYGALIQAPASQATASEDISSLGNTASPDINTSAFISLFFKLLSK